MTVLTYLTGFGNQHSSEAEPGALPIGRNSPQRAPLGLYAELLSGSAFTAPRADNRRTWMYRRRPAVVVGRYAPLPHGGWKSGAAEGEAAPPEPLRWAPLPVDGGGDFIDGLRSYAVNGEPGVQGMGALAYVATRAMGRRALVNADAEMLIVPQQGRLLVTTELGRLEVAPGFIVLLPRGMAFKVDPLDALARGYVCENCGAAFRLPELGPIGSNGLANPRDFEAPVAWHEPEAGGYEIVKRFGGRLWRATQEHSPFNVVAWHGNLAPYRWDTARFMTINTVSFDHPDPSIFTVLTSPSDTPGWANVDFVIFPPRWMVAEDTFRPPWYHRNVMSEFMGLVTGQYDAKPGGFKPGGASLHNSYVPHGPDSEAFGQASNAELKPHKLDATLAFMFETRWPLKPTPWALREAPLEASYADCWQDLKDQFQP
ncbi:homogentisate 1,2-dioxygenase [Pelomonas cellulosilytica]|uniref:Homogentisate 1,2-dioxygenase n=1 Tax=Pelomonas cellulosilytica TaxID=2906762 RepID=A0ABS8XPL1_9BURK|nr:homogentisate 1,2-dioxygenase [Pelomonas sp. P8]MCE4554689.1 homogentisate 1,2-dioxygenase [Pelomonas sp. P8]